MFISALFFFLFKSMFCAEHFIEELANPSHYNKYMYPRNPDGSTINVTIQLWILEVGPVYDTKNKYEVGYYFRQFWKDHRLAFNESYGNQVLIAKPEQWIWTPDIVVINAKTIGNVYNTARTLITPTGEIMYSQRIKATAGCVLNFQYYPFDLQHCELNLESYAYDQSQVNVIWPKKSIMWTGQDDGVEPPISAGYVLRDIRTVRKVLSYVFIANQTDYFVNLDAIFDMQRSLVYYVFQTFIPSTLLMVLNLGSYWIPDTAVPARITLIVTTFLSNTIILQKATELTAKSDYINPMQIFLGVITLFIVVSLVQFLLVLFLKAKKIAGDSIKGLTVKQLIAQSRRNEAASVNKGYAEAANNENTPTIDMSGKLFNSDSINKKIALPSQKNIDLPAEKENQKATVVKKKSTVHYLDRVCRIIIPLAFGIFSAVYWIYYLKLRDEHH